MPNSTPYACGVVFFSAGEIAGMRLRQACSNLGKFHPATHVWVFPLKRPVRSTKVVATKAASAPKPHLNTRFQITALKNIRISREGSALYLSRLWFLRVSTGVHTTRLMGRAGWLGIQNQVGRCCRAEVSGCCNWGRASRLVLNPHL